MPAVMDRRSVSVIVPDFSKFFICIQFPVPPHIPFVLGVGQESCVVGCRLSVVGCRLSVVGCHVHLLMQAVRLPSR